MCVWGGGGGGGVQWYRVGIIYPADLYNSEGNLLTLEEVRNTFGTNLNFLDNNRVRLGIQKFGNKDVVFQTRLPEKPIWPDTTSLINNLKKVCKDFYNVLTESESPKDLLSPYENLGKYTSNKYRIKRMEKHTSDLL